MERCNECGLIEAHRVDCTEFTSRVNPVEYFKEADPEREIQLRRWLDIERDNHPEEVEIVEQQIFLYNVLGRYVERLRKMIDLTLDRDLTTHDLTALREEVEGDYFKKV